ncbi:peptide chain release factor N(5)-glutamine methyltransferase [Lutibacter sp.]
MTIQKIKRLFYNELSELYPQKEIQSFLNLLSEHKLNKTRIDLALQPQLPLTQNQTSYYLDALERLKKQEPIQYIIGSTEFYGLPFKVNSQVLIPRPETEELVNWIINDCKNTPKVNILDIGTGSGCIAITLAKHLPNAKISAIDVSDKALKIAKENAVLNNVPISFKQLDILTTSQLPNQFDIIVSNPPYVKNAEKQQMQQNVLDFEPAIALFVKNENPLLFYDKISELAKLHLTKKGRLYFEINQYLGNEMVQLLKSKKFRHVTLKKDFYNVDRMVKAILD